MNSETSSSNRENKPASSNTAVRPAFNAPQNDTKKLLMWLGLGLGVLAIISLGIWGFQQSNKVKKLNSEVSGLHEDNKKLNDELEKRKNTTGEANIDKSTFQAVFLKNGQVYFGKITGISETQVTLENIYYLTGTPTGADFSNPGDNVSLVKLGNELHGPEDVMYIERKELNFWENLKIDSQVSKAIQEYEKQR